MNELDKLIKEIKMNEAIIEVPNSLKELLAKQERSITNQTIIKKNLTRYPDEQIKLLGPQIEISKLIKPNNTLTKIHYEDETLEILKEIKNENSTTYLIQFGESIKINQEYNIFL